jgi:hypothetical protein
MRGGGGLVFSEPKNASRRTLELPHRAVEALRSQRKEQAEEKLRLYPKTARLSNMWAQAN